MTDKGLKLATLILLAATVITGIVLLCLVLCS